MLETRVTEFSLPGYHLTEIIQEGANTILYRGYRDADRHPVMLNLLKADCLTPAAIHHLKAAAHLARTLKLPGIAAPLDGEPTAQCPALVLADFGGQSLQLLLTSRRLTLVESLMVLLQVVETLGKLHEHRLIHQQIRPSSLLINPESLAVCLIDPGLLSWMPPELSGLGPMNGVEDAMAYLAPEQTGRMNRPVDYRADFYALGVMFYQFLTGRLPFSTLDINELIHAHIAKAPTPPHELEANLPAGLSAIALKLLAKSPDDRYQSAYGLQKDLQHCLHQLQATSRVPDFALGRQDMSSQFRLPQKLYGRQRELTVLLNAFTQASDGQTTALWLSGAAGVGKSLLVYELQKAVLQRGGYFMSGKFDPLRQDVPYACLNQAFQELLRQVLTESTARIELWRDQLHQALGENAAVLLEILPELELILGPLPAAPRLGPVEAQYRFHRVFCQFVQVFAQRAHPLVLFLDQLQWADRALLQLVQRLLADLDRGALLLIGAYRETEVAPQSPFAQILAELPTTDSDSASGRPAAGATVRRLTLPALDLLWTVQLVADALHCDLARAQPLAELVFHRTHGNPLFAHQLLEFLDAERLLVFNFEAGQWQWQMDAIRSLDMTVGITEDVLTLMVGKIQKLAPATQHILKLAACIGERFDLSMLTTLSDLPRPIVTQHLSEALRDGLILPIGSPYVRRRCLGPTNPPPVDPRFRFLHDRVRQAAYSMIPEAERADRHWQVGQVSLRQMLSARHSESLFDVVNQLNLGQALIQTLTERQELAHLNWRAGQKAKAAAAYEPALKYFSMALGLLPEDSWQSEAAITLALWMEQAECQSLCGRFAEAGESFILIRQHTTTLAQQAEAYTRQMACYIHQNRDREAVQLGLAGLGLLGLSLPQQPSAADVDAALAAVRDRWQSPAAPPDLAAPLAVVERIRALVDAPPTLERSIRRQMQLLQALATAALGSNRPLYNLAILTLVQLSLDQGPSEETAYAYVAYGTLLGTSQGDYAVGQQFGQVGLDLSERYPARRGLAQLSYGGLLAHWTQPLSQGKAHLLAAFEQCGRGGEPLYALYAQALITDAHLVGGGDLAQLPSELVKLRDAAGQRQYLGLNLGLIYDAWIKQYFVASLRDDPLAGPAQSADRPSPQPDRSAPALSLAALNPAALNQFELSQAELREAALSEAALLGQLQRPGQPPNPLCRYYLFKAQSLYLAGQFEAALAMAVAADALIECQAGALLFAEHYFYYGLIVAAGSAEPQVQARSAADTVARSTAAFETAHQRLQLWAQHCPENFAAKAQLLTAERLRLSGQDPTALYDLAIAAAQDQGFVQVVAIGCELAGKYYLSQGRTRIAKAYLSDAGAAYQQWGAPNLVQRLRRCYGNLLAVPPLRCEAAAALDWMTVIKASQTLSEEIVFDSLMKKLMQILIENAGAQRGLMIVRGLPPARAALEPHPSTGGATDPDRQIAAAGHIDGPTLAASPEVGGPVSAREVPLSLIAYVERTQAAVVLDQASSDQRFLNDPYIATQQLKSALALPMLYQGKLTGVLYLENRLIAGAFTPDRLEILQLLTAQVSISMENARLYRNLQEYSQTLEAQNTTLERSKAQLQAQAQQLAWAFHDLKQAQAQLVQTEKLSSLGQLVAGVAHEVKNPLNFIVGNIAYAREYVERLFGLVELYAQEYPNPTPAIQAGLETAELEYLQEDLPKLLNSMDMGADRIQNIVVSLRNFSRLDEPNMAAVDIHEGLEGTLMILHPRLGATATRPAIRLTRDYGSDVPSVECYAGQLNQVVMNLIVNAVDAIDEACERADFEANQAHAYQIQIATANEPAEHITIRVIDNGPGMSAETQAKIFDAFFTTKPIGQGTGLGLSISHQIITEKHRGQIFCRSDPGKGTAFVLQIPQRQGPIADS